MADVDRLNELRCRGEKAKAWSLLTSQHFSSERHFVILIAELAFSNTLFRASHILEYNTSTKLTRVREARFEFPLY